MSKLSFHLQLFTFCCITLFCCKEMFLSIIAKDLFHRIYKTRWQNSKTVQSAIPISCDDSDLPYFFGGLDGIQLWDMSFRHKLCKLGNTSNSQERYGTEIFGNGLYNRKRNSHIPNSTTAIFLKWSLLAAQQTAIAAASESWAGCESSWWRRA